MGGILSSLRATSSNGDLIAEQSFFHPTKRQDITKRNVLERFESAAFRDLIAERLSIAVKIPTVTYDEMGRVGEDPRWDVFYEFSKYLKKTFPKVYENLDITTINQHAFLYTWKGSDNSLKPLVFMAHSDVVPASDSTSDRWTHPPFSGHYDGKFIWGRGSADDKCNVIAKLSAFEALLEVDFKPSRTVILALGFDEEGGAEGGYGARCLADRLLQVYGENGVEMILDEGNVAIRNQWGTSFATPGSAEKGYVDISVTIDVDGGHSSTPPDHTSIGYLAQVIQKIEENQFPSRLTSKNPTKAFLQTAAHHAKTMDKNLRDAILDPKSVDKVIVYLNSDFQTRALVRTSTAVDVIEGGVKSNALPETATVLVNHRIAVEESVQTVKDHYSLILTPLAKKWGLSSQNNPENEKQSTDTLAWKSDKMKISVTPHSSLEPSPVSDIKDERFSWLAGTLRGVFGEDVVVAPILGVGNTDTKFYWKLTPQIYRINPYSEKWDPRELMIHTVDERMPIEGMLESIKFYHEFIRVVDERRL
ncbi:Gly-Xaa carboxypeptidase [Mollisia scopiformis]|uniref:Gly-Xaa carboxypeptidase n=1 Tax=Mollisia scopiformis TaxID=149040 RepID=A0A194WX78_MOLSC|nr:Gly-Xaa carboxypeptidase [Mollisia scopiformis]KUJ12530.1 Gly-Xaa carboxypeptidase [Mollisia scopiformis]